LPVVEFSAVLTKEASAHSDVTILPEVGDEIYQGLREEQRDSLDIHNVSGPSLSGCELFVRGDAA